MLPPALRLRCYFLQDRYKVKIKRLIWMVVPVIITLVVVTYRLQLFSFKTVAVENQGASCITSQTAISSNFLGLSIFKNFNPQIEKIKKTYPCVKDIKLSYQPVNNLRITLVGRTPFVKVGRLPKSMPESLAEIDASPSSATALINWNIPSATQASSLVIDDQGVIFTSDERVGSSTLFFEDNSSLKLPELKLGSAFDSQLIAPVQMIFTQISKIFNLDNDLFKAGLLAKVNDPYLIVHLPEANPTPIVMAFNIRTDVARQTASLQLILQTAKIEGRVVNLIDLRFEKPIVIYGKKQ